MIKIPETSTPPQYPLRYCPNLKESVKRLYGLYNSKKQDIICAKMNIPSKALEYFARNHKVGFCDYPNIEQRIQFWDTYLSEQSRIMDDSVPSAQLKEFDQGLYGGLFGGDVRFICDPNTGHITSMVPPLLSDWSEVEKLSFNHNNYWYKQYLKQLQLFEKASQGKFGISHFIMINGLNFVYELRGATETYLGVEDCPEIIEKIFELAYEVNLHIHKLFFDKVTLIEGGTCSGMAQWIPGQIVSESLDPFHMTSFDYFEKWGRRPIERIFSQFDGGIIHIHGNGRHLLEAASSIEGLKAIYLGDDKGFPPAFEVLAEIRKSVGTMPLICSVDYYQFIKALSSKQLQGGVFYNVKKVPCINTANKCMDLVRKYSTT